MAQPPSFPLYVQDYLTGTMSLTPAERGVYVDCLCYQWEVAGVPGDEPARLALVMRCSPADARRFWTVLKSKFVRGDDGLYRNQRLEAERVAKKKWHDSRKENGGKGGRPPKPVSIKITTSEPSGSENQNHMVPSSSSSPSEPTAQGGAREFAPRRNPYGHSLIGKRNLSARWEGPIFDIPEGWAQKTLKASNGRATDADITAFGKWRTERLQATKGEAPTKDFLGWLDAGWTEFRAGLRSTATSDALERQTEAWRAEQAAHRANRATPEEILEGLRAGRALR